jgi:hypothetical protein
VFRQVLPPPDPEPFQKIAKGFRDIAEIESDLQELSRDVEALHNLRTLLDECREARETFRRYCYVREAWRVRDQKAQLDQACQQRESAGARVAELQQQISRLEQEVALAKERLVNLRESDNYKLLTSLEAREGERERGKKRIHETGEKIKDLEKRLTEVEVEYAASRRAAESRLTVVGDDLDVRCLEMRDVSPEMADCLQRVRSALPATVDSPLAADEISRAVSSTRSVLEQAITDVEQQLRDVERERHQTEEAFNELNGRLDRLLQFDDLVPPLPGLDEVLLKLKNKGIQCKLLFQHLEWAAAAGPDIQAAVEAALGVSRLATIVVSPEQTVTAQQIVLGTGHGVRVLDAVPVEASPSARDGEGDSRLLDFVTADSSRVRAHLEATIGETVLQREMPPDGASVVWFAADGAGGERGARWRLELEEARWIGEQRRRDIRRREQQHLEQTVSDSRGRITLLERTAARLRSTLEILKVSRRTLDDLQLPWSIQQAMKDLQHRSDSIAELSRTIVERNSDLDREQLQCDELSRVISELQAQIDGTDAARVKKQIDELERDKGEWERQIIARSGELNSTREKIDGLAEQIESYESTSAVFQRQLEEARHKLVAVLAPEQVGQLERYVFDTKRGSQLKPENLDNNVSEALVREVELLTKLRGGDGVLNDKLAIRYGFRLEDDDASLGIQDRTDLELIEILEQRQEQERHMQESLNEKTRELFETIFARDLSERLRADLLQVRRTLMDINRKLEPLVFGHSRFQLNARPVAEHRRLVDLIERQAVLNPENRDELRHYLEDRRDQLQVEGDVPPFLDYRYWFDYNFKLEHVGSTSGGALGSEDMVRGSVGAQTTHNYLLLLVLAALLFDRCQARLWLLMLDDAFYGLDIERKELLLRCGKQLGLDFVIATPDLDGTIQEHAGDSTTVLVEKDAQESVSILPFEWERAQPQGELFSEPRPEAIIGAKENLS